MSKKPVYSEQYFINLMAAAMAYGTIYVTSDANTYRDEQSAVTRCQDFMKLRRIVRYATITKATCPTNEDELNALMVTVESKVPESVQTKETPEVLDLAAAAAAPTDMPSLHRRPTRNRKALPTTLRRRKRNLLNKHKLPLTWLKLELTSS